MLTLSRCDKIMNLKWPTLNMTMCLWNKKSAGVYSGVSWWVHAALSSPTPQGSWILWSDWSEGMHYLSSVTSDSKLSDMFYKNLSLYQLLFNWLLRRYTLATCLYWWACSNMSQRERNGFSLKAWCHIIQILKKKDCSCQITYISRILWINLKMKLFFFMFIREMHQALLT